MKKNLAIVFVMFLLLIVPSYAITEGTNKAIKINTTVKDYLDTSDEVDYFSFNLNKAGSLKIDFDFDVKSQYSVKLLNLDTNKIIQNLTFTCEVNTVSGRYEKSGNYEKESNNTPQMSNIVDYNRKITGNLESKSDIDYYMVELRKPGTLQIRLQYEKDARYNIDVYKDVNGKLSQIQSGRITDSTLPNSNGNVYVSDRLRVSAGNYYVKISGGYWNSYTDEDYTMTILYSAENYGAYEKEPNDSANIATEIYTSETIIGNMNSTFDVDYYYTRLWGGKWYVSINVPQNAEYNVVVYKDVNGKLNQITSGKINATNKNIEVEDASGDYYIKVTSKIYSNEDYTILVVSERDVRSSKTIVLEVNNPYMIVDGATVLIDGNRGTVPVVVNNRVLLPIRAIIENLGGNVLWNEITMTMTSELNGTVVNMTINSNVAYVNGQIKYLDVPTQTINGRTMVPVRFIMENLGGNVVWNNNMVTINF